MLGLRGVTAQGGVLWLYVQLTSMGVGRLCWGVSSIPHQEWGVR